MDGERCETCKFWRRNGTAAGGPPTNEGQCRRNPPVVEQPIDDECPMWNNWPLTTTMAWCGEFKPRAEGGGA